jgi:serine/threonine-protein phosphatase PGAM5
MATSSSLRFLRHGVPAAGAFLASSGWRGSSPSPSPSSCAAPVPLQHERPTAGFQPDAQGDFHKLFPKRQLFQPRVEYPLWDENWDGRHPPSTGDADEDRKRARSIRKEGVTRHIILVRHGQYDETEKEDSKRLLTPLGREQAHLTGLRLRQMLEGASEEFGACNIKVVRVSNLARAKETAAIIASHLPGVEYAGPDPDINEGFPCHTLPGGKASDATIQKLDDSHPRLEAAFQKIFYRAAPVNTSSEDKENQDKNAKSDVVKHEYEIVVCHANVIRYFLCRALQIPPEAWLRLCTFNCSLTYLAIRPTGTVSCRMLGDMGHIPYGKSTFSMHTGFNW